MVDRSAENALRRQTREDRALVLDMLNSVYPGGLIERDLLDELLDLPRPIEGHNARRDFGYLKQLGLIESLREEHAVTRKPIIRWRLTGLGVQFIESGTDWGKIEAAF